MRARLQRIDAFYQHVASCPGAVQGLVEAVQGSLITLPSFVVKDHRDRAREASALSAPIKLRLDRDPSDTTLRELSSRSVMIEPLASVQAIEDFLWSRVKPQEGRRLLGRQDSLSHDDGESVSTSDDDYFGRSPAMSLEPDPSEVRAATEASSLASGAAASSRGRLAILLNGNVLPAHLTVLQAVKTYASRAPPAEAAMASSPAFGSSPAELLFGGPSGAVFVMTYRPWRLQDEVGSIPQVPACPDAAAAAGVLVHPIEGTIVAPPTTMAATDPAFVPLCLLRALQALSTHVAFMEYPVPSPLSLPRPAAFINQNLTSKLMRQVSDFETICNGSPPEWCRPLVTICPFICPFESRLLFLGYTAFGPVRALQRLKAETTIGEEDTRGDRRRLSRTKVRLTRDRLLDGAVQVMRDMSASNTVLEFEFSNEIGTGLGPTLEYYTLVSREFQRRSLGLWRDTVVGPRAETEHVFNPEGLFPRPVAGPLSATLLKYFDTLGRFMARACLDSRLLDITLSRCFYVWLGGHASELSLADIETVDADLYRSLKSLKQLHDQYRAAIAADPLCDTTQFKLNGVALEQLFLSFTLPGYPDIPLVPGGADIDVTLKRLGEYVERIVSFTLRDAVRQQFEAVRAGFNAVFPLEQLSIFTADEMQRVFCGSRFQQWDPVELAAACRPEHGYTAESDVVQWLYALMASLGAEQQRSFVSFVTGSPNLPVGGLRGLRPPLTIVPKTRGVEADLELPSAMTCQNYLKLPEYSSPAVLEARLRLALAEGQGAFLLS